MDLIGRDGDLRKAMDIPHFHHERWDGTGYPRGLAGENIPIAARIFAVVNTYEALTINHRPYKIGMQREQALDEIARLGGTLLDPRIVRTFLEIHRGK